MRAAKVHGALDDHEPVNGEPRQLLPADSGPPAPSAPGLWGSDDGCGLKRTAPNVERFRWRSELRELERLRPCLIWGCCWSTGTALRLAGNRSRRRPAVR